MEGESCQQAVTESKVKKKEKEGLKILPVAYLPKD